MTKEQIEGLRRLDLAATRTPWEMRNGDVGAWVEPENNYQREHAHGLGYPSDVIVSGYSPADEAISPADGELVVAMRNTFARLLDEREALLEALKPFRNGLSPRGGAVYDEGIARAEAAITKAEASYDGSNIFRRCWCGLFHYEVHIKNPEK